MASIEQQTSGNGVQAEADPAVLRATDKPKGDSKKKKTAVPPEIELNPPIKVYIEQAVDKLRSLPFELREEAARELINEISHVKRMKYLAKAEDDEANTYWQIKRREEDLDRSKATSDLRKRLKNRQTDIIRAQKKLGMPDTTKEPN